MLVKRVRRKGHLTAKRDLWWTQRLAQIGHGRMVWGKLIEIQDEIEGGHEILFILAEVAVNTAAQESRKGLGCISCE